MATATRIMFALAGVLIIAAYLGLLYAGWLLHPSAFIGVLALELWLVANALLEYGRATQAVAIQQGMAEAMAERRREAKEHAAESVAQMARRQVN